MHSLIKKLTKGLGREKQTRYEKWGRKGGGRREEVGSGWE